MVGAPEAVTMGVPSLPSWFAAAAYAIQVSGLTYLEWGAAQGNVRTVGGRGKGTSGVCLLGGQSGAERGRSRAALVAVVGGGGEGAFS